ncbi:hypothetical protein [Streptomyces sp. NPDC056600]|uniref:hypothetical protein n=1 Tax=Streptomyces sp. NPDC056600 TaxID=3345874 RepID=UPI003684A1D5
MATVTPPEEPTEAGTGGASRATERHRGQDRLGELVDWLETEYGPVTEQELAAAETERQEIERAHESRERRNTKEPS